jgi:hypothetical protein
MIRTERRSMVRIGENTGDTDRKEHRRTERR